MEIYEFVPGIRIGDVPLHITARGLEALGYFEDINGFDDILHWHTYTKREGLRCYVKDGDLVCIKCFSDCYFKGENIIGRTPDEILRIFGEPDEIGDPLWVSDHVQQVTYEFYDFGLQVWFESGKVISIFCSAGQ